MSAWPTGLEPGLPHIDWSAGETGAQPNVTCFKAPPGKFLPVILDLYNAQRMRVPIDGTLVPLLEGEQEAHDIEMAQDSLVAARDIACEVLKGWDVEPQSGPVAGTKNRQRAVMLRALVVNQKQEIVFSLDSTV